MRQRIVASVARQYPLLSGCGTFANSRLVRALAGESGGLAWGRLHDGSEVLVPLDDYVGRAIFYVGELDRKVTEILVRVVREGDVVLDVGANLGLITMRMARLVGDHGRVHAFEPNPRMVELLARTIERNRARNIKVHPCGLGSEPGSLPLQIPRDHAGRASLVRTEVMRDSDDVTVPIRTLSEVASAESFPRVRLMKIDVEGFESEVLRGGEAWFSASPPDYVLFESNSPHDGRDEREPDLAMTFLEDQGYRLYAIEKRLLFSSIASPRSTTGTAHDFIAVHRDARIAIESLVRVRD